MSISPERVGAFIEYVIRPMTGDIQEILAAIQKLPLPLSERLLRQAGMGVLLAHLAGELLRAITYVGVTWIVCQTLPRLL